ncbi:uncharacterized protein LOC142980305 [Anticarsia gemmatalis]|uniref:uncharacterized protein LOC142980305 n=1 Tax=Anticarsia gemmatalis TaxID=129554 RepID=UPI003F76E241
MAFKVKILSILLFICLIDSLHSASYRRMKRETEEPAPEKKEEPAPEPTEPEKKPDTPSETPEKKPSKFPVDIKLPTNVDLFGNLGQTFTAWISNVPWLGKH